MEGKQGREAERTCELEGARGDSRLWQQASYSGIVFQWILERSSSLCEIGCALAWALFNCQEEVLYAMETTMNGFLWGIHHAMHRGQERKSSGLYPLPGVVDLVLREKFEGKDLKEVMSEDFVREFAEEAWLKVVICGLNGLAGLSRARPKLTPNAGQLRAVSTLRDRIRRFLANDQRCHRSVLQVERELAERFLSYTGEEIPKMEILSLEQCLPALPPHSHGGSIEAVSLVSDRTKILLLQPHLCVAPDVGQDLPKLQAKVHIKQGEEGMFAEELVNRGICDWVPEEKVFCYRGQKVLNGLFGVRKPSFTESGKPVLRLIMNLIPTNSCMIQLRGSVKDLPSICQWLSIALGPNEELRFAQSDMSSAFYLFKLPEQWSRYICFGVTRTGAELGKNDSKTYYLSCRVVPMGWSSAVGIMQEMADSLARLGQLSDFSKVIRSKPVPDFMVRVIESARRSCRSWFHVYLDNFCSGEKYNKECKDDRQSNNLHLALEASWQHEGVLSSEKKRVSDASDVQELGALVSGSQKVIGPSAERIVKLVQTTLFVISRPKLRTKWIQVVAGRWVHVLQFRRAGMACLDKVWSFISRKNTGRKAEAQVKKELLSLCLLSPLLNTTLDAEISQFTTASDASSKGGAVGVAYETTTEGDDFAAADLNLKGGPPVVPIMVLSLFNGVGCCFRAYDLCGCIPAVSVSYEINKEANRVTAQTWPRVRIEHDIRNLTEEKLREFMIEYPEIQELHIWGGFPCVDLSSAKANRANLQGSESGLFYELVRILRAARRVFGKKFKILFFIENVASMDQSARESITAELGFKPFWVDPSGAVPIHRHRLCWTNVKPFEFEGVTIVEKDSWFEVQAEAPWPDTSQWIEEGWQWPGEHSGAIFPTCMKSIVRDRPPPKPAGIAKSSWDCQQRWRADSFRFPPYQYRDEFILWRNGKWRTLSASERELLHGMGMDHTATAMNASDVKRSPQAFEDCRKTLVGDSFSLYSFNIFAIWGLGERVPAPSYLQLVQRMGLAPGFCSPFSWVSPLARKLQYGSPSDLHLGVDGIHRAILKRVNHTGSDVRVSTGAIVNPKAYPRQSVPSCWWKWLPVFKFKFQKPDHINSLELRSIIQAVEWRMTHKKEVHCRVFHLTDSYVCMSIIGKGRSSSEMLQFLLRRLSADLLLCNLYLLCIHVGSLDNPTDDASRS